MCTSPPAPQTRTVGSSFGLGAQSHGPIRSLSGGPDPAVCCLLGFGGTPQLPAVTWRATDQTGQVEGARSPSVPADVIDTKKGGGVQGGQGALLIAPLGRKAPQVGAGGGVPEQRAQSVVMEDTPYLGVSRAHGDVLSHLQRMGSMGGLIGGGVQLHIGDRMARASRAAGTKGIFNCVWGNPKDRASRLVCRCNLEPQACGVLD